LNPSTIRLLGPGDEAALEAFLLPRVESSMFLVGNSRSVGIVDRGQIYQGTYAARFEAGEITGAAAHFWNGNLVLQASRDPISLCAEAVKGSGRSIKGLIGPNAQVQSVKQGLHIDETNLQMNETEDLYSLDLKELMVPDSLRSGQVTARRVEPADVELLTEWNIAYEIEALGAEDGPALRTRCREEIERSTAEKRKWVLEAGGQPVASSAFNTAIREAVQVGGVWTPPALRGRGYARAVVAASLLEARAEGAAKGILFTGGDNIAAQKAYLSLGFHRIGDYSIVLLRSPIQPSGW
jgi:uncharacterized protein